MAGERLDTLLVGACVALDVVAGGGVFCCCETDAAGEAPFARTEGSVGGGPSRAHLLDSYFDRTNDSILLLYS